MQKNIIRMGTSETLALAGIPSIIFGRNEVWYNSVKDSKNNLEGSPASASF